MTIQSKHNSNSIGIYQQQQQQPQPQRRYRHGHRSMTLIAWAAFGCCLFWAQSSSSSSHTHGGGGGGMTLVAASTATIFASVAVRPRRFASPSSSSPQQQQKQQKRSRLQGDSEQQPSETTTAIEDDDSVLTSIRTPMGMLADAFADHIVVPFQVPPLSIVATSATSTVTKHHQRHAKNAALKVDLDTVQLLKACHLFADVMKRAGHASSAADLSNNIRKVQTVYDATPAMHRRTVYALLQYEKNQHVHPVMNSDECRLKDPSAAMGLLWIRRSIAFNCDLYSRILPRHRQPAHYQSHYQQPMTPVDAAMAAYHNVLQPYHGWALRRLSQINIPRSFPTTAEAWWASLLNQDGESSSSSSSPLRPALQLALERDMQRLVQVWEPLLAQWQAILDDLDLDDNRQA